MPPEHGTRIVIADDHELARSGLRAMLEIEPDLDVVGEATNGDEVLDLCRSTVPDLVLTDLRMARLGGIAIASALKTEMPTVKVLIVTLYDDPDILFRALRAGADGYVLKSATQAQIVTAIRHLLIAEVVLVPAALSGAFATPRPHPNVPMPEHLTPREMSVLRLLARGRSNQEIARDLRLALGTVKVHIEHILAKLAASSRTQAAVRAIELGLLPEHAAG